MDCFFTLYVPTKQQKESKKESKKGEKKEKKKHSVIPLKKKKN